MRKETYLYLDDNDKATRDGDVKYINSISELISIRTEYPCSWHQRSLKIEQEIASIDGLILDWEYTNVSAQAKEGTDNAENVDFSAESLAEHIRISAAKGQKDIPIIICSANKNKGFTKARERELTSLDLFDLAFIKQDIFDESAHTAMKQLYDLSIVYKKLQSTTLKKNPETILSLSKADIRHLDIRFIDLLETMAKYRTTHDLVQFLLREFIEKEGLLINEQVLAARLGVDIKSNDWGNLLGLLTEAGIEYSGYLNIGWKNFWAFKFNSWWKTEISNEDPRYIGATQRVILLNEKLKLQLKAAEKIKFCSSDEYWTICIGTKRPLDPINGFAVGEHLLYPWQEVQYVSAYAELEKTENKWKINVMDRERYNHFKSLITKAKS